jgi:hypothetical protein
MTWLVPIRTAAYEHPTIIFSIFLIMDPGYPCRTSPDGYPVRHLRAALRHPVSITAFLLILTRIIED